MNTAKGSSGESMLNTLRSDGYNCDAIESWAEHPNPIFRRNRYQTVATFPIFAYVIARQPEIPIHMAITAAIDRGDVLIDALASILGVSKKGIRYLRGKSPKVIAAWLFAPTELLRAIELIPLEKLPRDQDEWQLFREFWIGCFEEAGERYLRRLTSAECPDVVSRHLIRGLCYAGYEASATHLRRMWQGNMQRLIDTKDYFRFVASWCSSGAGICEPSGWLRGIANKLSEELLTRYSAMELIHQSNRWHEEIVRLSSTEAQTDEDMGNAQWPALPGLPLPVGELFVYPITNSRELQAEGNHLEHCVGTYDRRCIFGTSHIVSVRSSSGASLSTAEISLSSDSQGNLSLRVVQHRGARNQEPTNQCEEALRSAMTMLCSDTSKTRLIQIDEFHVERRRKLRGFADLENDDYPIAIMSGVMAKVLRDYPRAMTWLDQRMVEEEGMYRYRNELAGDRLKQMGFAGELTDDRAFEMYRTSGNEDCLRNGIVIPETYWRPVRRTTANR